MRLWATTNRTLVGARRAAVAALAALIALTAQPADAQHERGKLDRHLRSRVEEAPDDDVPVRVIVSVRPGARRGLQQKVRAHGGRAAGAFNIIDAGAAELSPKQLRTLALDRDVVSISVDADVRADGVASAISGVASKGGYSLRSALGLRGIGTTSTTKTFQQGDANA